MEMQIDQVIPLAGGAPISLYIRDGKFVAGPAEFALEPSRSVAGSASGVGFGSPRLHLDLPGALALPGLINSHDHLEFNCFPALGDRHHADYVAWGKDIHARYKPEIDAVLRIPGELRARWGIYKNLLGGVTTVVQHGRSWGLGARTPGGSAPGDRLPIQVVESPQSIHSIGLESQWRRRLNNPLRWKQPCVIHIGEGVNELASAESRKLLRWNLLNRKLVAVHGIAMTPAQASRFQALVWCPESNYFLYGKTADVVNVGKNTSLIFGTDSTLTGDWDIWKHIRLALQTEMMDEAALMEALTLTPARVWDLPTGRLAPGYEADLVLMRAGASTDPGARSGASTGVPDARSGANPDALACRLRHLSSQDILLVLSRGNPVLVDESLYPLFAREGFNSQTFSAVQLGDSIKYVQGDLPGLMEHIHRYDPTVRFPVYSCTPNNSITETALSSI